jgi:hypothetical protein
VGDTAVAGQDSSYDIQPTTLGEEKNNHQHYAQISCSESKSAEKNSYQLHVQSSYSEDKHFLKRNL